jgi:hypothetical protein
MSSVSFFCIGCIIPRIILRGVPEDQNVMPLLDVCCTLSSDCLDLVYFIQVSSYKYIIRIGQKAGPALGCVLEVQLCTSLVGG